MGLTERERKVLDELERGLYADDAELANRFRKAANQSPERKKQRSTARLIAGVLVILGGLMVILTGAIMHYALIGVAGFATTLAGLVIATGYWGSAAKAVKTRAAGSKASEAGSENNKTQRRSIFDFFEERWDRRSDEN